jgi:peptidoglycan/LPS O-acetylase OafA/YrhL
VLSFVASLWLTTVAQPWAFFGMPTRIWEFALGGSLALALNERTEVRTTMSPVLQWAGLAMIAFAAMTYGPHDPYPGFAALMPALGACFLLLGGNHGQPSLVSRLLGVPWLTWLGRMSYAWYLWHWPIVGVAVVLFPSMGVVGRLGWSAAALGLAWLTHRFIEAPVRSGLDRAGPRSLAVAPSRHGRGQLRRGVRGAWPHEDRRGSGRVHAATAVRHGTRGPDESRMLGFRPSRTRPVPASSATRSHRELSCSSATRMPNTG